MSPYYQQQQQIIMAPGMQPQHTFPGLPTPQYCAQQQYAQRGGFGGHARGGGFTNNSLLVHQPIGRIDAILRKLKGNEAPFGGVTVVFMGDFYQIPPVGMKSIPSDILAYRAKDRQPFSDQHQEAGARIASNWRSISQFH
jgi:hypothetical protein